MEMIRTGVPPTGCEQQDEADALCSQDDLIRLLPSCWPRAGLKEDSLFSPAGTAKTSV